MRVTESIKQNTSLSNMMRNSSEAERISQNISTGRRVLRPSDDPVNSVKGERNLRNLTSNSATRNNINVQRSELNTIDYTLEEIGNMIKEAKVITLEAANGHMDQQSMNAAAFQMEKLGERLFDMANTRVGKTYLFSGTKSFTAPITLNKSGKISDQFYPGDVFRSNLPVGMSNTTIYKPTGSFTIFFSDAQKKEHQLNIVLSDVTDTQDLVTKINQGIEKYQAASLPVSEGDAAAEKILHAQIGADKSIYIDSAKNVRIRSIDTDIFQNFGTDFVKTTEKDWTSYSGSRSNDSADFVSIFGEALSGTLPEEFTLKIVSSGSMGEAEYVILNGNREIISEPQTISGTINAPYTEDAEPAWTLAFDSRPGAYFREGLEFRFFADNYAVYQGNDDVREIPLDNGKKLPITVTANELFFKLDGKSGNTFDLLKHVREGMQANQQDVVASYIDDFDAALNKVLKARANTGSTTIEVDAAENRVSEADIREQESHSELIDQSFPEAATDLQKNQLKADATYQVTSKLIQPGLIKFLN